ncbi:MAG: hypothetical protein WCY21_05980 [Candidatus Cloacimonadaceae bacterium]|jgi:hypothetical protein|nr:hypothetical protein [Candidatus Cloacimonadota bacterium]MDX9950140.1 hypothetical protein [Candidatus Syntrophosphaera sp.]NLN85590.1 hypothetical protein [Candidatus Cloacimonadota bacterium]
MRKKRFLIVEELVPASLTNIPENHKKHYLDLGYRPYRMGDGKVKWLTEAGKAYSETRGAARNRISLKKASQESYGKLRRKRRHRRNIWTFLAEYWPFIVMAIIILIILYIYVY